MEREVVSRYNSIILNMLREDIKDFLKTIPENVKVVAATKYVESDQMRELYAKGIVNFGENRVEPFLKKYDELKDLNVTWHFIGHLQRNKAKDVINKIDYLHSLDSLKLAKIIDTERKTPLKCFIEVSINLEENKNGVPFYEIDSFIDGLKEYKNIEVVGFMMMAVKYSNHDEAIIQFKKLKDLLTETNNKHKLNMEYLSMGMSDDYMEAISQGSTHVRLGRILWNA